MSLALALLVRGAAADPRFFHADGRAYGAPRWSRSGGSVPADRVSEAVAAYERCA